MREFLEKQYDDEKAADDTETKLLAVKALLEVVQSGSKSIEIAVMKPGMKLEVLTAEEVCIFARQDSLNPAVKSLRTA